MEWDGICNIANNKILRSNEMIYEHPIMLHI